MKLKGISMIEQHVEKLFLGVMTLIFLAILSSQLLGSGTRVKIGSLDDTPIDRAYDVIAREADARLLQLREDKPDSRAPTSAPDLVTDFLAALGELEKRVKPLPVAFGPTTQGATSFTPGEADALRLSLPQIPPATRPLATAYAGALDPLEVAYHPDLAAYIPREQPFDMRVVTVEATYDAASLVALLNEDPDGDGPEQIIPRLWWQKDLQTLDVQLWRQELMDDGSYSDEQLIPPPPSRASFRDEIASLTQLRELHALARASEELDRDLLTPRMYHMIAGDPWLPPSLVAAQRDNVGPQRQLQNQLRSVEKEIQRIEQLLGDKKSSGGGLRGASDMGFGAFYASAQPGGIGGGGGQTKSKDSNAAQRKTDAERRKKEALVSKLQDLTTKRDSITQQLGALGFNTDNNALSDPVEALLSEPIGRMRDGVTLRLWAHDITVESGKTYRYRLRIIIPNPLYGYDANLDDASKKLAANATLASEPSPWSDPVTTDKNAYLFVTDARPRQTLETRSTIMTAKAELYRFFYGYWRQSVVTLQPGDTITAQTTMSDLNNPRIFDIEMSQTGEPGAITSRSLENTFSFDTGGWQLVDVTPKPRTASSAQAGADSQNGGYQAVLSSPAGELQIRDTGVDSRAPRRQELLESVAASADATILDPDPSMIQGADASKGIGRAGETKSNRRQGGRRGLGGS